MAKATEQMDLNPENLFTDAFKRARDESEAPWKKSRQDGDHVSTQGGSRQEEEEMTARNVAGRIRKMRGQWTVWDSGFAILVDGSGTKRRP